MSLYEKEVFDKREREERGEGIGESSSATSDAFELLEALEASDAKSTSSSGIDIY